MRVFALGYWNTGSSAIVHLIKEFSNCQNDFDRTFEHVLFYTPHGLFDLEDAILKNNTILKSDAAINDFYKAMKRLNDNDFGWCGGYRNRYGDKFMKIVDDFISSLIEYTRKGGWDYDFKIKERKPSYKSVIKYLVNKYLFHKNVNYPRSFYCDDLGDDGVVNYCFDTPEEFYNKARAFIDSYFELIGYENNHVIVLDQMLQPQHLSRFLHYAKDDDRFIVVKRDVRDLYISSKYLWAKNVDESFLPSDPLLFVSFYNRFLNTENKVYDKRIMRIYFEDLVYHYEETLSQLRVFIGDNFLGKHVLKGSFFKPDISIKNTQVFTICNEWKQEVQQIEKLMLKHLYKFPYSIKTSTDLITDPNPNTRKAQMDNNKWSI